jgi:ribosomal protein S18 acetylase RimI-like enzyme
MNPSTVHIYHNRSVSLTEIESLFVPIFGHVYSYPILLNMSDHIWCAYSNDQLIGCVLAKQSRHASILYLILFGIEKLYRSLGIGTYLLSAIIEYTRRCFYTRICLHTECTNGSAIGFYRKFHFHIDLYLENYYQTMTTFYPHAFQMSREVHPDE